MSIRKIVEELENEEEWKETLRTHVNDRTEQFELVNTYWSALVSSLRASGDEDLAKLVQRRGYRTN